MVNFRAPELVEMRESWYEHRVIKLKKKSQLFYEQASHVSMHVDSNTILLYSIDNNSLS